MNTTFLLGRKYYLLVYGGQKEKRERRTYMNRTPLCTGKILKTHAPRKNILMSSTLNI